MFTKRLATCGAVGKVRSTSMPCARYGSAAAAIESIDEANAAVPEKSNSTRYPDAWLKLVQARTLCTSFNREVAGKTKCDFRRYQAELLVHFYASSAQECLATADQNIHPIRVSYPRTILPAVAPAKWVPITRTGRDDRFGLSICSRVCLCRLAAVVGGRSTSGVFDLGQGWRMKSPVISASSLDLMKPRLTCPGVWPTAGTRLILPPENLVVGLNEVDETRRRTPAATGVGENCLHVLAPVLPRLVAGTRSWPIR